MFTLYIGRYLSGMMTAYLHFGGVLSGLILGFCTKDSNRRTKLISAFTFYVLLLIQIFIFFRLRNPKI